ncbi:hypothetical protein [Paenibacillus humicus]|uniref:hypothetical protein n=1 Tax=Paenibacillus humicus TaxID=412861 RepID=UPI003F13AB62
MFGFSIKKIVVNQSVKAPIKLIDILYLIKHGYRIGLTIEDQDDSDRMQRVLKIDGVEIGLSEWAEWTMWVKLHHKDRSLMIYHNDNLTVNWHGEKIQWYKHSQQPLELVWSETGAWCDKIEHTLNQLIQTLRNLEQEEQNEKVRKQQEKIMRESEEKQAAKRIFKDIYNK